MRHFIIDKLSRIIIIISLFTIAYPAEPLQRNQIKDKYKWDLSELYDNEEAWQQDLANTKENINKYNDFKGKPGTSAKILYDCLEHHKTTKLLLEKVYLYAKLSKDVNMKSPENISRWSKYTAVAAQLAVASSFIQSEIRTIPADKLEKFIQEKPALAIYSHYFDDIQRKSQHSLTKNEEEMLAQLSGVLDNPFALYGSLYMDIDFPKVVNNAGDTIIADRGISWSSRRSKEREFRKAIHANYFSTMGAYRQTFSNNVNNYVNGRIAVANIRGYDSALELAFGKNNLPVEIYDNLLNSITANLQPLHRWMELKKDYFGYDTLYFYDTEVTMFPAVDREYTYEEAMDLLMTSLTPMGNEYLSEIKTAYENRWIDVFPSVGKESAGYSSGPNYPHAFVKINWRGTLTDFYTLVHEMGHYVHANMVIKSQPHIYREYPPFLAEIASTTAENVSYDYLIKNAKTDEEKLYFIEQYLNNTCMMLYNTTMMAHLEKNFYDAAEAGEPMNSDEICQAFKQLNERYYGNSVKFVEADSFRWLSWAHYYLNYYVYSYATSYAASTFLAENIIKEGETGLNNFLSLLKAGRSDYPHEILKNAGVDLTSPEPIVAVAEKMNRLMNEMEEILKKQQ